MEIDLGKIEAQIRKLEEVRRIASDPELLAMLEQVMVNGASPAPATPTIPVVTPEQPTDPLSAFKTDSLVWNVAKHVLRQNGAFSGYQIASAMQAEGFQFNGRAKPGATVADIIRTVLIKKGRVRVYRRGSGTDPTLYVKL